MAEEAATARGLEVKYGTVITANDITQAVQSIVNDVDVIYIPTDNVFAASMATAASVASDAGVPIICGEDGMCSTGGLATVGIDYTNLGYQTGEMAIEILEGADVSTMPIQYAADPVLSINLDTAAAIGYEFPQEILDAAVHVYGGE